MIDAQSALGNLHKRLTVLPVGHALEVRSYKRDRYVLFVRLSAEVVRMCEHGFEKCDVEVDATGLRKLLKTVLKREFPRSRKLRLYDLGAVDPAMDGVSGRKKI